MDPVTAVGLAGTVIQFVTFACSLLSAASEIHNSKTGIPTDLTNILNVHEQLQSFRARFIAQDDDATDALALRDHGDEVEGQTSSLGVLFRASEADCNRIIKLVEKLKIKSGPLRRWKSFKAALELVWRKGDIEELDKRLQRTQSALTLHICAMTSHYHQSYSADLRKLRDTSMRYQIAQTDKIEDMFRILQSLETRYLPAHYEQNRDRTSRKDPIFRPDEIDDLGQQIAELSVSVDSLTLQQDVLRSLNFDYRSLRHENIPLPHNRTFDWVYRTENLDNQHHLLEWLERGYGIFWVSGKPGSGKSTFMKFLADSPRTRKILDSWAYPRKVLVASHYFWNAGTDMQKSQQGLLREILFNILCQRPDLIHSIGPDTLSDPLSPIVHEWTIDELRKVLLKIATPGHNVQLCLFIDGLDEFSGDHQELCKDLKQLADASHVKICVSSRPWNAFQDAFGNHPLTTLRMQDFTEPDILAYVENQLSEHPRWSYLNDQPTSGSRLVQEVTRRAQGVFLWVVLVTKLLRQGLTNDDTFSDMLKRLEQFPSDLEPFFKQMLDRSV
ncbi:hypothetical protein F5Y16DRAFT_26647 [Xylariaceae sp. FL0255]|nr:hypothetical protein F5Y16DRAFT_26647 [Xylariaceae sp. FL0255]